MINGSFFKNETFMIKPFLLPNFQQLAQNKVQGKNCLNIGKTFTMLWILALLEPFTIHLFGMLVLTI